ncbi:SMR family transporter [Motilimonas pumila]|uniref:Spermidine export protein MdtJ n=1 Tax=Motilimonas pumila TaxID=2303987 RepID=A0A418YAP8_9GAMM|nr:SMR family transporter [Motilimonas pumila]RJG40042.1 QacE family quaternary ammonium compound efflux SMR transporter [Motilimonas pumila]
MWLARGFLLFAILAEIAGTSSMKLAGDSGNVWGYLAMYTLIALSYFSLSLAAKKIAIGVAYACWEGLGIALITLTSVFFFESSLSAQQLVGLLLVIVGVVLVTLGESHDSPESRSETNKQVTTEPQIVAGKRVKTA